MTFFCCNPERALHEQLAAECERAWRAGERALDLARERELDPPTAVQRPEEIDAAIIADWDAYDPLRRQRERENTVYEDSQSSV